MVEYRIRNRGRELGSFTMEQLESMLDDHQIGMMAEVYDGKQWITVADMVENVEEERRREREQLVLQQKAAAERQEEEQRRREAKLKVQNQPTRRTEHKHQRAETVVNMAVREEQRSVEITRKRKRYAGFSVMAFLFTSYYYAGYGNFWKGFMLAVVGVFLPFIAIIIFPLEVALSSPLLVNIYAGAVAKSELPVGGRFEWSACFGMVLLFLLIYIVILVFVGALYYSTPPDTYTPPNTWYIN
jgi:hypothetical protein